MANKSIKISIATALNAVGITAAQRALSSLASQTKSFAKTVASNLMNVKAGFDLISTGARKFLDAMSKGMEFERMTVTFKSLTGSLELAKAHMRDLQDLGRTPPFSLEEFAAASQAMMKMTGGMAGFKNEMQIVGDMAAATGNDIATVGRAFGLAYQVIRDGQDFGRAGQQLYSLGILTKKQVAEFAELSKAGLDNAAVWEKLQGVFDRYKGAMAETEKTTKGFVEAIQGEATVAMTDFSAAISEGANPVLEVLLGWLKKINEDGTIEEWADKTAESLECVKDAAKGLAPVLNGIWKGTKFAFDAVGSEIGRFAGAISVGNFGDAISGIGTETAKAYERAFDPDGKDEEARKSKREERAAQKAKRRAEDAAKAEAEAKKRIQEDMRRAQEENDKRAAEEAARREKEDLEKLAEKRKKEWDEAQVFINATMEAEAREEVKRQRERIENIKEAHDAKMKKLDEEEKKTQAMIDRLKSRGAENPFARDANGDFVRVGGGNWQAREIRDENQRKFDEKRFETARKVLEKKMEKAGATIDDPSKMGRLSNLERAVLERMQLDDKQKKAADIAAEREKLDMKMRADIGKIKEIIESKTSL